MPGRWKTSWHHDMLGIPQIWTQGITGKGVTIALVDTGLAKVPGLERPDFEYFDAGGKPGSALDLSGHGTCCGSILASRRGGVLGIAPEARIVSYRALETGNAANDVEASLQHILQARADVDIVSCSFVVHPAAQSLRQIVRALVNAGKVVVAAAGDREVESDFPEQTPNAITVAALDRNDRPLQGARTGPWIDLSAPGKDIPVTASPADGGVVFFSQSSAAAPVVSAVAALALSSKPAGPVRRKAALALEGLLKSTAAPLAGAGSNAVGAGRVNPQALINAINQLA